jgi:hypothetical protein
MGASHCSLSPIVHPRVGTALVLCNPYHARKRSRQSLSQVAKRKSKPMRESRPNGPWEPNQNTAAQEATEARRDDLHSARFDYNYDSAAATHNNLCAKIGHPSHSPISWRIVRRRRLIYVPSVPYSSDAENVEVQQLSHLHAPRDGIMCRGAKGTVVADF